MQAAVGERYKVLGILGQGGMGVVYRVADTELDTEYALKMLPKELAADMIRLQRFRREMQLLAGMDHPNIVRAIRVGVENEQPFLVMEKVDGRPLSDYCAEPLCSELSVDEKFKVLIGIASGLAFIHEQGVVHRDLKPSNVLVGKEEELLPKLIDFGLAMRAAESFDRNQRLTQTDVVVGSAPYVCPEQWLGKSADMRSDVYAFGCIAYELFTGRVCFSAESAMECMLLHFQSEPTLNLTDVKQPLGTNLSKLVSKCLAKDPDKRYQNGAQLLEDLRAITGGGEIDHIPAKIHREQKTQSHRVLGYSMLAVFLFCAGGIALYSFLHSSNEVSSKISPQDQQTVDEFEQYFHIGHKTEGNKDIRLNQGYKPALAIYSSHSTLEAIPRQHVAECMWEESSLYAGMGNDAQRDGRPKHARELYRKAAECGENWASFITKDHPEYLEVQELGTDSLSTRRTNTVYGYLALAMLYEEKLKDWKQAESCYARAWEQVKKWDLPYDTKLGAWYMRCLYAQNKTEERNELNRELVDYLGVHGKQFEFDARSKVGNAYWDLLQVHPVEPNDKGSDDEGEKPNVQPKKR